MKQRATIRDNTTGEIRVYESESLDTDQDIAEGSTDFLWSEGNYACDCNRGLFFARAADEEDPHRECGSELYTVLKVERDDGKILYAGDADAPRPI